MVKCRYCALANGKLSQKDLSRIPSPRKQLRICRGADLSQVWNTPSCAWSGCRIRTAKAAGSGVRSLWKLTEVQPKRNK